MNFKSLRFKVLAIVAVSLLLLFALQYFAAHVVLLDSYARLEADKTRFQAESAKSLIEEHSRQLGGVASDWAHWDDTYAYMVKPNDRYIESNYTDATFDHLKVNAIILTNSKGEIIYKQGFDFLGWKAWQVPAMLQSAVARDGVLTRLPDNGHLDGLLWTPEGLFIVSATDILPTNGKGERHGVLTMARRLDPSLIGQIERVLGVRIGIHHLSDKKLSEEIRLIGMQIGQQSGLIVKPLSSLEVAGYIKMRDVGGDPDLLLRTVSDRSIYEQGLSSLNFLFWSTLLIVLVLAIFSWLFDKLVLARLAALSHGVREIGESGDTAARVHEIDGEDELSSLAHSINGMLDQLTESQKSLAALSGQLSHHSSHDELTGLLNRYEFDRRVELAVEDANRNKRGHCIATINLDQFRLVNDSCGHMVGDVLLVQQANQMRKVVRDSDALARMGGDEFALLLVGCPLEVARRVCENLLKTISEFHFAHENRILKLTASIGLTEIVPGQQATLVELLNAMDVACTGAKADGGDRCHVCKPDDAALTKHSGQLEWVGRIHEGLEKNLFRVYWQRMETLVEGADPHCELLIRMVGEDGTFYSPGEFLPIAERYHLMPQIDRWMVREALSIIARKGDDFSYICAINLSGQSLSDEGLLGYITAQLKEKSIDSRRICFEITETTVISDLDRARHLIDGLKELGCSFSLDDFGSGLSSFGYLKNLRVDYLKIDGMFVRNIASNTTDRAMVEAINHVGHVMELHTIAEFAETDEIVQILRDMGVDYAQGYGVAKPEPFL